MTPAFVQDCNFRTRQRNGRQDEANAITPWWAVGGSEDEEAQEALEQVPDGPPRNQGHPGRVPAGEVRYAGHHPRTYQAAQAEGGLCLRVLTIGDVS